MSPEQKQLMIKKAKATGKAVVCLAFMCPASAWSVWEDYKESRNIPMNEAGEANSDDPVDDDISD